MGATELSSACAEYVKPFCHTALSKSVGRHTQWAQVKHNRNLDSWPELAQPLTRCCIFRRGVGLRGGSDASHLKFHISFSALAILPLRGIAMCWL